MSAVAAFNKPPSVSSRRISELDAIREVSRIAASSDDVTFVLESIGFLALKVSGINKLRIEYTDPVDNISSLPSVWGLPCEDGSVGFAVASIAAAGHTFGKLHLYFELKPSVLESSSQFANFLAQQIALQLSRLSLTRKADSLRKQVKQLQNIIEKRKALQRARAIVANRNRIDDMAALRLMRQYSREMRLTLHQVAEALILGDVSRWTGSSRYVKRKPSLRLLARNPALHN